MKQTLECAQLERAWRDPVFRASIETGPRTAL